MALSALCYIAQSELRRNPTRLRSIQAACLIADGDPELGARPY